jgi:hypothetical protein
VRTEREGEGERERERERDRERENTTFFFLLTVFFVCSSTEKLPFDLDGGVRAIELGFNMLGPRGQHTGNVVAAVHARVSQRSHLRIHMRRRIHVK